MTWPSSSDTHCSRLSNWLSVQDAGGGSPDRMDHAESRRSWIAESIAQLRLAENPLIWIESADVAATRTAVKLARLCNATLHAAQSQGAASLALVKRASGMLGTSLAEVRDKADCVIHLGREHLRQMPLLGERFLQASPRRATPDRKQIFVGENPAWPRGGQLEAFTQVLLSIRGRMKEEPSWEAYRIKAGANSSDRQPGLYTAATLADELLSSDYSVIVWSEEEFSDEIDRLLLERLLEIAWEVSRWTRCSLLPLDDDPGRTTSRETLLWLTNRSSTRRWGGHAWADAFGTHSFTLEDWRSRYDWILAVRNLPSDRPLPDIRFDRVLEADCNLSHQPWANRDIARGCILPVAAVGIQCSGHLTRCDHGFSAYIAGSPAHSHASPNSDHPTTASAALNELCQGMTAESEPT